MKFVALIGLAAAIYTTVSDLPRLQKTWQTGETDHPLMQDVGARASGLGLWVVYGFAKSDMVVVAAGAIGVAMVLCIPGIKLRARHP